MVRRLRLFVIDFHVLKKQVKCSLTLLLRNRMVTFTHLPFSVKDVLVLFFFVRIHVVR